MKIPLFFENIGNFGRFSTFLPRTDISIVRLGSRFSAGQKEPKLDCLAENRTGGNPISGKSRYPNT